MSQDHLVNYRHVPLCEDGLKCRLMMKSVVQHCETHRHCKLKCRWGGFCPRFHDHEHIEDYIHPFDCPCPFTPYMCQFHVTSLQNKTEPDHVSAIDIHCFRYAHVCPFGRQCTLLTDKKHLRSHIHIARRLCPEVDNCPSLSDDNHLNSFTHSKIRDICLLCQYSSLDCRDRSNPEHRKRFRHTGNFDHIGIVHYSGFNQNIDFVRNQTEMIDTIRTYLESAKWTEANMTVSNGLRDWIRALQPVHRCDKNIFESVLVHGHVMSRDHMNSLRDTRFVASTVKQHKKLRLIFDRVDNVVVHRNAQEYIQELVEIAFRQADQEKQATTVKEEAAAGSKSSVSLDGHCVESKLRQKEKVLRSSLTSADIQVIRALTVDIVNASLQLLSIPTGIGYEPDRELGTDKHVFAVLGPHAGYYYGDIFLVFRHELMCHPDANFSIQAATTFGKSENAYRFRPWLKNPGTPETRIAHFHRNKLHCSIMGYEYAAASELVALASLRAKSTVDTNLKVIQQQWLTNDSHCVFEAHLPKLIPLDYIDRVYIAKTTFDSLTESAQQAARTIFGNGLIITCHEIDAKTKPAGLHKPLDDKRKEYQSFVLAEIFAMIEAKSNSLASFWGTVITIPASKFEQQILIPMTISQSYDQHRSNDKDFDVSHDDNIIYIYWRAMHGDMMLSVTNEVINSHVDQPNLKCLVCYVAAQPLNSTVEKPSQPVVEYREGYSYLSDDQPVMHEVVLQKRRVKTGSNFFHRGCNTDDYATYCLTMNRKTGEVTLSHAGSNCMYNNEKLSYRFDEKDLDLTQLNYIQVSAGSQTVPIRDLVIRHDQISELHPSVDPAFRELDTINTSISTPIGITMATSPYHALLSANRNLTTEQSSNLITLPPCPDSVHCLLQHTKKGGKHNAEYSHPCRFSEVCRNKAKESHLVHIPHLVPMCSHNKYCSKKDEPLHRAQYRHSNLPDYLVPCRSQSNCDDKTPEHRIKYSHGEKVPLPGCKD